MTPPTTSPPSEANPLARALLPDARYVAPAVGVRAEPAEAAPSTRWPGYSTFDYTKDFVASESLALNAAFALRAAGVEHDPTYELPAQDSADWKALSDGIDPEKWQVFGSAMSASHAQDIRFRLREEEERKARLMEGGMLPFLAGSIINPESLLLAMASGGISWVQKGSRLQRAMKTAGVVGAENVALEAPLYAMQDTRDVQDVAYAAAAGITLGFAFGSLGKGLPDTVRARAANTAKADADKIATAQAEDLGLIPRRPAEDALVAAEREIGADVDRLLAAEERRLLDVLDSRDAFLVNIRGNGLGNTEVRLADTQRLATDLRQRLARPELDDVRDRAKVIRGAMADEGATEVDFVREHYAIASRAREEVRLTRSNAERDLTTAEKLIESLGLEVSQFRRTRGAEIQLDQLRTAKRTAKTLDDRVAALDVELQPVFAGRLAAARKAAAEGVARDAAGASSVTPEVDPGLTFGADSGGAARIAEFDVARSRLSDDGATIAATTLRQDLPALFRWLPRFDYSATLRGIRNEALRNRAGRYVGDPSPKADDVSPIGASEEASRLRDRHATRFHQVYENEFSGWVRALGGGRIAKLSRKQRAAFGKEVTREIRGIDTGSAHAKKAAARMSELFAEIGQGAADARVKGFEEFTKDARYFPRVPDRARIIRSVDAYGESAIVKAVAAAMRKGYSDLGLELADDVLARMSAGYFKRLNDLSLGIQNDALTGLRLVDVEQIAGLLRLGGASEDVIADTVPRLRTKIVDGPDGGTVRYSKSRALLDEDEEHKLRSKETGQVENVSLRDLLFLDDAEQVFLTYNHSMSGWTSLSKQAGIRSKADHERLIEDVRRETEPAEAEKVSRALDDAYKFIVGQPLTDTNRWQTMRRIGRTLRDYQFARVMNAVGFAQVPDAAAYLTPLYFKYLRRHFPEMRSLFSRMQNGQLEHKVARDLEEWVGGGTDMLHNKLFSAFDDSDYSALNTVEHGVRVLARVTERNPLGVGPATVFNQRLAEIAITQRIADNLLGKASDINAARFRQIGLNDEILARIKGQLEKHTEYDDTANGTKLRALDLAKWDDHIARDKFVQAIHRESRRLVQDEDFGDTYPLMHSDIGKILLQFRRFGLVSYAKQLHRGIADRDAETLTRLVMQVALGSMSYASQLYLYSLTKPAEEAQEWRDKYLTPSRIFFGGVARAGLFSLTPMLMESLWQISTGTEGAFPMTRSTGLAAGVVAGIPAFDFASRVVEFTADVAQSSLRDDRQFDQRDYRNLRQMLPLQNLVFIKQALDLMEGLWPEGDEDADSENARFVLFGEMREKAE